MRLLTSATMTILRIQTHLPEFATDAFCVHEQKISTGRANASCSTSFLTLHVIVSQEEQLDGGLYQVSLHA